MLRMGIDPLMGYSSFWRSMRQGGDKRIREGAGRFGLLLTHPNPNVSIFTVSNQPFSGW
jgi:hypothetical protein